MNRPGVEEARVKVYLIAGSLDGGGSERQTLTLLQHLDRSQFDPHLLLLYRRGVLLGEVPQDVPVDAYWDHARARRISYPGQIHRDQVRWLRSLLQRAVRPTVVYDRTYHSTLIAGPAARGLGIGRVATIVAPPDVDLRPERERFVRIKRRRLARAYHEASAVVAVSRSVARATEQFYGLDPAAVQVLHNPIDVDRVRAMADGQCAVSTNPVEFNIACVGRMTAEKGQADLIDALALLDREFLAENRVRLWLVGDGALRGQLEQQVANAELGETIRFTGHLENAPALIRRCDLVCVPSHYEGMPNVALEALACGVPVLGTDCGGTPEILAKTAGSRLVAPRQPQELAEALRDLILEPLPQPQAHDLAAFDLRSYMHRIENILRAAANSGGHPQPS